MNIGLLAFLFVLWVGVLVFLRSNRIWLFYYLVGAVGVAYWIVYFTRFVFPMEQPLAHSVAWMVNLLANSVGIQTRIFQNAPGVLLVLVIVQEIGWTVLNIGVESSGLLEMSALVSLISFYPGWTWQRRTMSVLGGLAATWLANILRMLLIVVMLHGLGKQALVLAHTYLGKLLFFLLTVGIYWYLVTLPTIRNLVLRPKSHNSA
jgi:exosortase family protein XrtG